MKTEDVSRNSLVLFIVFVALCFIFTFIREPLAEVNNWILLACREGRVTKGASAQLTPAKVKIEQLKGVPTKASIAAGATTCEKEYKGVPVLTVDIPKAGESAKGEVYISKWAVLGPLKFAKHPVRKDDFCFVESVDIDMVDDEAKLDGFQAVPYTKWTDVITTVPTGKVDLKAPCGNVDFAVAYAVVMIDSPEEIKNVSLKIGSDDYAKIWVDGEQVLKYSEKCRSALPDSNMSENFTLKKGLTRIVFKCVQITFAWEMCARLVDGEGNRLCLKKDFIYFKKPEK